MNDDMALLQKSLDERKFEFEVKKYDEEKSKRSAELRKLRLDIKEAKKPFYRKAAYLAPVATISVAILGGIFALSTDALKEGVNKLRKDKAGLEMDNKGLLGQQDKLKQQIGDAQGEIITLGKQKDDLAARLPVERLDATLEVLQRKSAIGPVSPDDPLYLELSRTSKAAVHDAGVLSILEKFHSDPETPLALRPTISTLLFKLTSLPKWKSATKNEAQQGVELTLSETNFSQASVARLVVYMQWLHDPTIFSPSERAAVLKAAYDQAQILKKSHDFADDDALEATLDGVFLKWDIDALVLFREPWMAAWGETIDPDAQFALNPQGYSVGLMDAVVKSSQQQEVEFVHVPKALKQACNFPVGTPLCAEVAAWDPDKRPFVVPASRRPDYVKWDDGNAKLVTLFWPRGNYMAPDPNRISKLRSVPNDVFRDIALRRWVINSRIPD